MRRSSCKELLTPAMRCPRPTPDGVDRTSRVNPASRPRRQPCRHCDRTGRLISADLGGYGTVGSAQSAASPVPRAWLPPSLDLELASARVATRTPPSQTSSATSTRSWPDGRASPSSAWMGTHPQRDRQVVLLVHQAPAVWDRARRAVRSRCWARPARRRRPSPWPQSGHCKQAAATACWQSPSTRRHAGEPQLAVQVGPLRGSRRCE